MPATHESCELSLLVPVRNFEETLDETVRQLREGLRDHDCEILVLFDVTEPQFRDSVEQARARLAESFGVRSFVREDDIGFGSALRFGARQAKGRALMPIMADLSDDVGQEEAFAFGSHQYAKYGEYLGIALFPVSGADWQELSLPADGLRQAAELGASLLMIAAALMLIRRRDPSNVGVFVTWWFFTSLAGNSTLVVLPVSPAQLYLPGASLALFLVVAGMAVADEVPARLAPFVSKAAWGAAALVVVIVGILLLTHENQSRDLGGENQRFVRQLRQEIPSLQPGSVLYVVDAPFDLLVFNDDALEAAVQLYYGDVEVQAISPDELSTATLTPGDHVFRYVPR